MDAGASIIAFIQLTQAVGGALMDYYEGVKNARDDIQQLYHSIKNLEYVLEEVKKLVGSNTLSAGIKALLEDKNGPVTLCESELVKLRDKLKYSPAHFRVSKLNSLKWPFQKKDIDKIVRAIDKHKDDLVLALGIENLFSSINHRSILEDIKSEILIAQKDAQRREIINWLKHSLPDPSTEYVIARKKFQKGTGLWLVDGDEFKSWSKSNNSFMWLNAGAGAGKSILCSTVIELLQQQCQNEIGDVVSYWYITYNSTETQNVTNILRSWIRDICSNRRDTPQILKDAYKRCNNGQQQPTHDQAIEMLKSVVDGFGHIYLIIDALDEFPKAERDILMETILDIHQWKLDAIHIFATSRAEDDIKNSLEELNSENSFYNIQAKDPKVKEDIMKFIDENMKTLKRKFWTEDLRTEVKQSIAEQADGMFRLATLQFETVKGSRTAPEARKSLKTLPKTLDDFYERAFKEIPDSDQSRVKIILQWITYSARKVTVEELLEVLLVRTDAPPYFNEDDRLDDILDMIPSIFVTTYSETRDIAEKSFPRLNIRLAHYSVKEYLVSDRILNGPVKQYRMQEVDGITSIAETCLAYLLYFGTTLPEPTPPELDLVEVFSKFPLIEHAVFAWTFCVQELERFTVGTRVKELAVTFLDRLSCSWQIWLRLRSHKKSSSWDSAKFFSTHSFLKPTERYVKNCKWSRVCDPLSWASFHGLRSVHTEVMKKSFGDNINKITDYNDVDLGEYGNALHAAALGKASEEYLTYIVKSLLSAGMDPNSESGFFDYPLIAASAEGNLEICKILLEAGADIEACHSEYGTALTVAAEFWKVNSCEMLVRHGANIEGKFQGKTPLRNAVYNLSFDICDSLLNHEANVNHVTTDLGGCTKTALYQACVNDALPYTNFDKAQKTIALLLEAGADVQAECGPLDHWAYGPKVPAIIGVLERETPYSYSLCVPVLNILLKHGAGKGAGGASLLQILSDRRVILEEVRYGMLAAGEEIDRYPRGSPTDERIELYAYVYDRVLAEQEGRAWKVECVDEFNSDVEDVEDVEEEWNGWSVPGYPGSPPEHIPPLRLRRRRGMTTLYWVRRFRPQLLHGRIVSTTEE